MARRSGAGWGLEEADAWGWLPLPLFPRYRLHNTCMDVTISVRLQGEQVPAQLID